VPATTSAAAAFARVPAGVVIITTGDPEADAPDGTGAPHGSTATMWAESADPPLLLTTIRRDGTTRQRIALGGSFGVSLLEASQVKLTWQFADPRRAGAERFAGVPVLRGPVRGLPLLADALASVECDVQAIHPFGKHDIVVGLVLWAQVSDAPDSRPVIHYGNSLWGLRESHEVPKVRKGR
jgi:3-hydroxy-9,10-secoandrosta-1,3,5(10)-triene-9,17-dione monooxygenase reductase component